MEAFIVYLQMLDWASKEEEEDREEKRRYSLDVLKVVGLKQIHPIAYINPGPHAAEL